MDAIVADFLTYLDASPSPYHAVKASTRKLDAAGFSPLRESDPWALTPGAAYYVVRGGKTVIAWRQGAAAPHDAGFRIIAAHTDSPVLKIRSSQTSLVREQSFLTAEVYGSPLLHTWLDRDLKLAGAAFVRTKDGRIASRTISPGDLTLRVASLAPHLKKGDRTGTVTIDPQKDLRIFLAGVGAEANFERWLADQAGGGDLVGFDLFMADGEPAALIGLNGEFISSPRLDNLFSSFCALTALVQGKAAPQTQIVALYDAEEIGSGTWTGAQSNVLDMVLERIVDAGGASRADLFRAKARSILISADMAHAEHPSFTDATDPAMVPQLNRGLAMKTNAKGSYATGHDAAAWLRNVGHSVGHTFQSFSYRCDHGGGSTVGPYISTSVGISGVDIGGPMLAMHSIRELAGAADVASTTLVLQAALGAAGIEG